MKTVNTINILKRIAKSRRNFVGSIDIFSQELLAGWVKFKEQAQFIDIYLNGTLVAASVAASEYREDVKDAGYGHGRYGFTFDISKHIISRAAKVEIAIRPAGSGSTVLSKSISFAEFSEKNLDRTVSKAIPNFPAILSEKFDKLESDHLVFLDKVTATQIQGWSVSKSERSRVYSLRVLVDGTFYRLLQNNSQKRADLAGNGISDGTGGFSAHLNLEHLDPGEHTVTVVAPDGTSSSKILHCGDSIPGGNEVVNRSGAGSHEGANLWVTSEPCDLTVVVPVYNAADDLRACIERLANYTPDWVSIIFINDESPDPAIKIILEETSAHKNMRVLHNRENLGFTRTVNKGLNEAGGDDVIILNSDARVTPGWIQGIRAASVSRPRVATVTAMSDRAGAFSAPRIGNDNVLPPEVDEITYARAFRRRSAGLYPSVPTGNGFCMFISRACVRDIGMLDADAFPKGYGEENDFCMRARRAGWVNLIDDRTYVFHDRSKSFGESKTDLMKAGREIIDKRYPEYKTAISIYRNSPSIEFARFRALQALEDCAKGKLVRTRVLYVVSTRTGGTPQTNRDLMGAIDDAVDGWLLRCDTKSLELSELVDGEITPVKHHTLSEPVDSISHRSNEYDAVITQWLLGLDPDIVHIRHLGWHGISLPKICRQLEIHTVFSFHDFYTLCPSLKLIDAEQHFCGGVCTQGEQDCTAELWPEGSMPRLRNDWVHVWRERFSDVLKDCDAFITTSESTRSRIMTHFPHLSDKLFPVIPHGRDFIEFRSVRQTPEPDERIRILVPGNISGAKGLDIIEALIERDSAEYLEFHILGDISMRGREPHPRIIRHGKYSRQEFSAKAEKARPHLGAIFSIWDETYCHTLTELWSIGLPAMVFDFPTVAGRVRQSGGGWVLDHSDITALYERILEVAFNPEEMKEKTSAVDQWQRGYGRGNTTRIMGAGYLQVYRRVLRPDAPKLTKIGVVCPQSATMTDANASTQIRVWERTLNHVDRDLNYIRLHPASLLDLAQRGEIDGVIIQRTAIPRPMVDRVRAVLCDNAVPYIVELDDDLLNVPEDKDPTGKYRDYAPFLSSLLEHAAAVTVSTTQLEKRISQINPNTNLVPNLLSERLWRDSPRERARDGFVRAIYMGTNTHTEDLRMIMPAMEKVASQYPEFRLSLIGITDTLSTDLPSFVEKIEIPQDRTSYQRFVPWLRDKAANVDFGIAPLVESNFNTSKSPLKILEYGALGLPVLASDTAVYRDLGNKAPQVKLVKNNSSSWIAAVKSQIEKGSQNRKNGEELRNWVLLNRMLRPTLEEYDAMVKQVVCENGDQITSCRPPEKARSGTCTGSFSS